jgi:ABC-type dipeptide/oligopeptide/nickel transport system permease subunit
MKFHSVFLRFSRVRKLWTVLIACAVMLLLPVVILPLFANTWSAYQIDVGRALHAPSSEMWFGTDALGRSQWDRALLGTILSFRTVILSLVIAFPLSVLLGGIAGLAADRWPDRLISWMIALLHTTPFFLLVVAAATVFGSGVGALPWLIGGVIWAAPARIVRVEVNRLAQSRFVLAEQAQGYSMATVFRRSLLPLTVAPAALSLLYLFPEIVGIDAVLALFGLGAQPPTPTLGDLIYEGIRRWDAAPWLAGLPAAALFVYCIALHLLADRLAEQVEAGSK